MIIYNTNNNNNNNNKSKEYKAIISWDHQSQTLWFVGYSTSSSTCNKDDYGDSSSSSSGSSRSSCSSTDRIYDENYQQMMSLLQSLCYEEVNRQGWMWCRHYSEQPPHRTTIALVPNTVPYGGTAQPSYVYRWKVESTDHHHHDTEVTSTATTTSRNHPYYDQWIIYRNRTIQTSYSTSPYVVSSPLGKKSTQDCTTTSTTSHMALHGLGMHRILSYNLTSSFSSTESSILLFQLLPKETFVEDLPTTCRIVVLTNNQPNEDTVFQCQLRSYVHLPIDVEQPSFASSPYIVAYSLEIVRHVVPMTSLRTTLPSLFEIQWNTTLHFRYPNTNPRRRVQVTIDPPYPAISTSEFTPTITDTGSNCYSSTMSIVTSIPAGSDNDIWYVSIITHFVIWLGCAHMLRSILRFSSQRSPTTSRC